MIRISSRARHLSTCSRRFAAENKYLPSYKDIHTIRNKINESEVGEKTLSHSIKRDKKKDSQDATRDILKKKENVSYYDPANTTLNLSLDNRTLYHQIYENAAERMEKRFTRASKVWREKYEQQLNELADKLERSRRKNMSKQDLVKAEFQYHMLNASISPDTVNDPIAVGDLVTLNHDSIDLYIVVSCPQSLEESSYSFVNNAGEIVYGSKQLIKVRFPKIFPPHLIEIIAGLVQLEEKFQDMAPVGVPDANFSKSRASKPESLRQPRGNDAEAEADEGDRGSSGSTKIDSDFIVAQASSQLLTNSDVNTFHVPVEARALYSKALTSISLRTFEEIPIISRKLEILHRVLQFNDNGDCLDSPKSISMFLLLKYIESIDLDLIFHKISNERMNDDSAIFKEIRDKLAGKYLAKHNEKFSSSLGATVPEKSFGRIYKNKFSVSTVLSLVLALRTQGRLWNLSQKSNSLPLNVHVLPLSNVVTTETVLAYLKLGKNAEKFVKYVTDKMKSVESLKPIFFEEIISLFKGYIAGNFTNDPAAETAIVSVLRMIEERQKGNNFDTNFDVAAAYDFSKLRAFRVLKSLGPSVDAESSFISNPFTWCYSSLLPYKGILWKSDLDYDYYNLLDKSLDILETRAREVDENAVLEEISSSPESKFLNNSKTLHLSRNLFSEQTIEHDSLETIRQDFGNTPIYCIDSETAHEIDDGISIHENESGERYVISIHVANPTSYLSSSSTISRIALDRGFTVYLPEGPTMMLPKVMSTIAGLGGTEKSRTLVVQYELNKCRVDEYIRQRVHDDEIKPEPSLTASILAEMQATANVKLYYASNFPSNYTYNRVNHVLDDQDTKRAFIQGKQVDVHACNLYKLYYISTILKDMRVMKGNSLDLSFMRSSVSVEHVTSSDQNFKQTTDGYEIYLQDPIESGKQIKIVITNDSNQNLTSKSQLLVSQFMISANYLASVFAENNGISIIHRSQEMNLVSNITTSLRELSKKVYHNHGELSVEETSKVLQILTSAKYQVHKGRHEALGLDGYATVTSPLRRYADMVNHWKFEEFLNKGSRNKLPTFKDEQLHYIASHLQCCELNHKTTQRLSSKFWEGMFFEEYFKLLNQNKIAEPITFSVLLKSSPKYGNISVDLIGFNNLRANLESSDELIEKFNTGELKVGQVITRKFDIVKLDYIEDEILFSCK